MRSLLEDNVLERAIFRSLRLQSSRQILTGHVTLPVNGSILSFFEANGANRNLTLDSYVKNAALLVGNIGASHSLVIKVPGGAATLVTLDVGEAAWLFCSGTDWIALQGGATINGITAVIEDVAPELGGNLDGGGFNISDVANVQVTNAIRINDTDDSHYCAIQIGSNLTANRTFTLTLGDANRVLNLSAGDVTISAAGAALIDDADAAAQRTTLAVAPANVEYIVAQASSELSAEKVLAGSTTISWDYVSVPGQAIANVILGTTAEYLANTAGKILSTDKVWGAGAEVTLTDAATIATDMSTFINAVVTLGGNRTLGNPTNEKPGQSGYIRIVQDGTGTRTLAYGTDWEFAGGIAPSLSTAANAQDILFYTVMATNRIYGTLVKALS